MSEVHSAGVALRWLGRILSPYGAQLVYPTLPRAQPWAFIFCPLPGLVLMAYNQALAKSLSRNQALGYGTCRSRDSAVFIEKATLPVFSAAPLLVFLRGPGKCGQG